MTSIKTDAHAALHREFRWQVPARFNIARACCTRWAGDAATAGLVAVAWERDDDGASGTLTYAELQAQADRLSHALRSLGVHAGDRVAICLPQRPETAVAHIALYQAGAVAMPLSMLFGPDALAYRLQDSGAVVAIVDENTAANVAAVRGQCPTLRTVIAAGAAQGQGKQGSDVDWRDALAACADPFDPHDTAADDPAVLIYTSGTTGPPKGALLPQRALLGNLPGFVCSQNGFPDDGPAREPLFPGKGSGERGATVRPKGSGTRPACSGAPPTGPGPAA